MKYESIVTIEAEECSGVKFTVRRMSFGRRLELARSIRDKLGRLEFLSAGEKGTADEAEAAFLACEIDRQYAEWGLTSIEGLEIDGEPATPQSLLNSGPDSLVSEVLEAVYREAGLNGEERKNSESHSTSSKESRPGGNATNVAV